MATVLKPLLVPPRGRAGRVRKGAWIVLAFTFVQIASWCARSRARRPG